MMTIAGTTNIKAATLPDGTAFARVGDQDFRAKNSVELTQRVMFYLLMNKPKMSPEEYAEHATFLEEEEAKESEAFIASLTEEGMSEHGMVIQTYRAERESKLHAALDGMKNDKVNVNNDVNLLIEELQRRTGYQDIETSEALKAYLNWRQGSLIERTEGVGSHPSSLQSGDRTAS